MVFGAGSGWPGIHFVDQAGLQFTESSLQVLGLNASPLHPAIKMAQWVKALAPKPHALTSIPSIHLVKGENQLL